MRYDDNVLPDTQGYHPHYLEELGVAPWKLRVYYVVDDDHADDDEPLPWQVDGIAFVDGKMAVSQACVNFEHWADAIEYLPSLWMDLSQ